MRGIARFSYQAFDSPYCVRDGDICEITHIWSREEMVAWGKEYGVADLEGGRGPLINFVNTHGKKMTDRMAHFDLIEDRSASR